MKVILLDNHKMFLQSLGRALCHQKEVQKVYKFNEEELHDVRKVLNDEKINVIIIDINLGEKNGFIIGKAIRKAHPNLPILFLSGHNSCEVFDEEARKIKFSAYLTKDVSIEELLKHLKALDKGLELVRKKEENTLSEIERQILYYMSLGYTNKKIGEKIHYSTRFIEKKKTRIFKKFNVKNEKEAIRKYFELGYNMVSL